jgi:hypothetical protein
MMRALALAIVAGCASSASLPAARFTNAPPAAAVNDRTDITQPQQREFVRWLYSLDGQFTHRVTRALELHRHERARGINALDEVPNSTWFTNRIGVRALSAEEIAAAPGGVGSPEPYKPWTITSTKAGGMSIGFMIKDSRAEKFLLKFDVKGHPEGETATQVITGKLMWAFGFNVTEDYVVYINKRDLVLSPQAKIKDQFGKETPLTQADVDRRLARIDTAGDGSMRVLVSHWLPGTPLGGHAAEGVRADDPNDRIPHELRRDLRGAYALFAWLDHWDIHEGNTLDMYVSDPADPKRHYVKHYWVDYGIALGFAAQKNFDPRAGYEWYFDFGAMTRQLLSLGAAPRAWEHRGPQYYRGLGRLETALFDPGTWKSSSPAYVPIYLADRIDNFWAAKIIMKLTREQIRAAVDAGRLSDPHAAAWLTDALIERQRATGRYRFERVNPIDELAIAGDTLCFKDLSIVYAFEPPRSTRYTLRFYTASGTPLRTANVAAGDAGVTCAPVELAPNGDGYTIVEVATARPHFTGTTYVHLAREPKTHAPQVIGIWRP